MATSRQEYEFLETDSDILIVDPPTSRLVWYTLAGHNANSVLAQALERSGVDVITSDDFSISLDSSTDAKELEITIRSLEAASVRDRFTPPPQLAKALKFSECLPEEKVRRILRGRFVRIEDLRGVPARPGKISVKHLPKGGQRLSPLDDRPASKHHYRNAGVS